jgi:hypothetical protein
MPADSIDIKQSTNILRFGIKINMLYLVRGSLCVLPANHYLRAGTFIVNHYREAAELIKKLEDELSVDKEVLGCTDDSFKIDLDAEKEHLSNLEKPDPVIETKKAYVKSLRQLFRFRYVYSITTFLISLTQFLGRSGKKSTIPPSMHVDNWPQPATIPGYLM